MPAGMSEEQKPDPEKPKPRWRVISPGGAGARRYAPGMAELARGAMALHGPLKEVVFLELNKESILVFSDGTRIPTNHRRYGYDIRREPYAFAVANTLGGADPFGMLAFGYTGSGPDNYFVFLEAAGFQQPNVGDVRVVPLRLLADGTRIAGTRRRAQWSGEVAAASVERARRAAREACPSDASIFAEEIVCEAAVATSVVSIHADSADQACAEAKRRLPALSEVLKIDTTPVRERETRIVRAADLRSAEIEGKQKIERLEAAYTSIETVSCHKPPRSGFLGIGKRPGEYEVVLGKDKTRVTIEYRAPAKIKVTYGPRKLLCEKCGKVMATTSEGIFHVGHVDTGETMVKVQCLACDLGRLEKKYEIDGEWIQWADGTRTVV